MIYLEEMMQYFQIHPNAKAPLHYLPALPTM